DFLQRGRGGAQIGRDYLGRPELIDEQETWVTAEARVAAELHHRQEQGEFGPEALAWVHDLAESDGLVALGQSDDAHRGTGDAADLVRSQGGDHRLGKLVQPLLDGRVPLVRLRLQDGLHLVDDLRTRLGIASTWLCRTIERRKLLVDSTDLPVQGTAAFVV